MPTDWAALYESMYSDLVRFLYRKVWDAQRAEDLAQETFLKALKAIRQFEGKSSFYTWLYRIVTNVCIDEYRRCQRRQLAPDTRLASLPAPPRSWWRCSPGSPGA